MSAVKLLIEQSGGDPVEVDVVVEKGMSPVTVTISAESVTMHSATAPAVVPGSKAGVIQ